MDSGNNFAKYDANTPGRQPDNVQMIKNFFPGENSQLWVYKNIKDASFIIKNLSSITPVNNKKPVYINNDLYVTGNIYVKGQINPLETVVNDNTELLQTLVRQITDMQKEIDDLKKQIILLSK